MFNYRKVDESTLEFVTVARKDELADGGRLLLNIGDLAIAVFQVAGNYYAIADVCTHDDGPLAEGDLNGATIECPRHGARFDLATGKATRLPAVVDIAAYPVRLAADEIQVGLPAD
ncbi:MAG TPA: non-heme iron oxygenase ferredoxin subunit [Anaerolineales bacterium]|nr:non-heme iron oxygenase ferredoxin subunit [Anaerolineales bacterium]